MFEELDSAYQLFVIKRKNSGQTVWVSIRNQYSEKYPIYYTSRKYLRTKVTPDFHLTYSKNGGNLGLVLNDKK